MRNAGAMTKPAKGPARTPTGKSATARVVRVAVHLACLVPFAVVAYRVLSGQGGANPIEYALEAAGEWAFRLLLITLAARPAAQLLKRPVVLSYRRMLGLYTFFYAACHMLIYAWLDQFFDWGEILLDIEERPFILLGFSAFVLLIPLAATSFRRAVAALGANWKRLHRAVYVIAILGLIHYWMQVRANFLPATVYLSILVALFGWRIYAAKRASRTVSR